MKVSMGLHLSFRSFFELVTVHRLTGLKKTDCVDCYNKQLCIYFYIQFLIKDKAFCICSISRLSGKMTAMIRNASYKPANRNNQSIPSSAYLCNLKNITDISLFHCQIKILRLFVLIQMNIAYTFVTRWTLHR